MLKLTVPEMPGTVLEADGVIESEGDCVVTVAVTLKLTEFEAALPGLLAVTLQVPGVSSLSNW
jgi:hypothetical protein